MDCTSDETYISSHAAWQEQDDQMVFQEGLRLLLDTSGMRQLETATFTQGAANDAFSDNVTGKYMDNASVQERRLISA